MHWAPPNTHDWFGWANAVISELLPIAATLSLRRRLRQGKPLMSYPLAILLLGAVLSIGAQLAAVGSDASWSAKFLACLPALAFLLLSKMVLGDLDAGRKQKLSEAEEAERRRAERDEWEKRIRLAREEAEAADRKRAEAEENLRAECEARVAAEAEARAEVEALFRAEQQARKKAEERVEAERAAREVAEAEAVREAEERAEDNRKAAEEIARLARHAEEVQASARDARAQAAAASDAAARIAGQLDEARAAADRAVVEKVNAEQRAAALDEARQALMDELARVRAAHDRLARKAEDAGRKTNRKSHPRSGSADRKRLAAVPALVPMPDADSVPAVPGVSAALTARVVAAMRAEPEATQERLAELAGTTDRTVRNVLKGLAALPAGTNTDDRAAV